jgi:Ion channel
LVTDPVGSSIRAQARLTSRLKQTGRATWLLLALILLPFLYPLANGSLVWRGILGLLNSAILVTGAAAASGSRRTLVLAVAFALPALGLQWAIVVRHDPIFAILEAVTMTLFYIFAIAHILAYVLRPGPVTGNKLHGAIAAYIMLGLLWAFLYMLIDLLVPGSFDYMGQSDLSQHFHWVKFVFFSFVTLTTTGYGDMVPMMPHAQSAAVLEQLAGTFFVAVLIARLAGLYQPGGHDHEG